MVGEVFFALEAVDGVAECDMGQGVSGEVLDNEWYLEGLVDAEGRRMRALRSRTQALVLDSSLGVRFPRILKIIARVAVQGDTSVPYSSPHLRPEVISDSVAPYGERPILTSYHPSFVKVCSSLAPEPNH